MAAPVIKVDVDCTVMFRRFKNYERRLAFAVQGALNQAARDVQTATHAQVRRRFVVRRERFLFGTPARPGGAAGRISTFASVRQNRPYAEVMVGVRNRAADLAGAVTGTGRKARGQVLLPVFEFGGDRKPFTPGAKGAAIPLLGRPARPSIKREVPPAFTISGLNLKPKRAGGSEGRRVAKGSAAGRAKNAVDVTGARQLKGRERTFLLRKTEKEPTGGIFQRVGKGRGDIRAVYLFRRDIKLKPSLGFFALAEVVGSESIRRNMELEAIQAIKRGALL